MSHSKTFDQGRATAVRGMRRDMSVMQALEWAFAREHASIDFDDNGSGAGRAGVSPIWVMMQRGQLGCQIDGGGRSSCHPDAEVIAIFLEAMPRELGGKAMALMVAELGRAGMTPDWMKEARPRCVPVAWRSTKHGSFAKTAVVGVETYIYRGQQLRADRVACPVRYVETVEQIGFARRRYLEWWSALLWLRQELLGAGLTSLRITRDMPLLSPWDAVPARQSEKGIDAENVNH
jgi:hypothetical protein